MSVIQLLVMDVGKRPSLESIKRAASAEEPSYVPQEADLSTHTGYLPIAIGALDTGFEYYFDAIEDGKLPAEATKFGAHQMISRTGGDLNEMYASLLFFRTAARLSGAAYVYPDDAVIVAPEEVHAYLTEQISLVRGLLK